MKQLFKKIYTILILIKNVTIRKQNYTLHFIAENDPPIKRWYYDFKHWGFAHANLEMVAGADDLCELYANGQNDVTVSMAIHSGFREINSFNHPSIVTGSISSSNDSSN